MYLRADHLPIVATMKCPWQTEAGMVVLMSFRLCNPTKKPAPLPQKTRRVQSLAVVGAVGTDRGRVAVSGAEPAISSAEQHQQLSAEPMKKEHSHPTVIP